MLRRPSSLGIPPSDHLDFYRRGPSFINKLLLGSGSSTTSAEILLCSDIVLKLSSSKKNERILVVTDVSLYIFYTDLNGNNLICSKRIMISDIINIINSKSYEFIININNHNDLYFKTYNKNNLLDVLSQIYLKRTSAILNIENIGLDSLQSKYKTPDLINQLKLENSGAGIIHLDDINLTDILNQFNWLPLTSSNLSFYEPIKSIGIGEFGKVILVSRDNVYYALKTILKQRVLVKELMSNFKLDIKCHNINNPFILPIKECFLNENKESIFILTEYCEGGDLYNHLKIKNKFTEVEVKTIISELILAILTLHENGLVHRNISPENILIDSDGHIRVSGFLNASYEPCHGKVCPVDYAAPEILRGLSYGKSADWWSVGVLLYELLVGFTPYARETENQIEDAILCNDAIKFPSTLSEDCRSLLTELLNHNPVDRLGAKDVANIKSHPFFNGINFENVLSKSITPGFIPVRSVDAYVKQTIRSSIVGSADDYNLLINLLHSITNHDNIVVNEPVAQLDESEKEENTIVDESDDDY